jgi:hypothetical protein
VVLPLSLLHVENYVCLSRGVQVVGVAWRVATRIMAGVGYLVQRTGDGRTGRVLGGWMIGRLGDAVSGLKHARGDEQCGLRATRRLRCARWIGVTVPRKKLLGKEKKS